MTPTERRVYATDLVRYADAYRLAASAPGLRKDAAAYLRSEGDRLVREAMQHVDMADAQEDMPDSSDDIMGLVDEEPNEG